MTSLLRRNLDNKNFLRVLRHQTGKGYERSGAEINNKALHIDAMAGELNTSTLEINRKGTAIAGDDLTIENLHPEKAAIPNRKPPRGIRRLYYILRRNINFVFNVIHPQPTEEKIQQRQQLKADMVIKKQIMKDIARGMKVMSTRYKELTYYQKVHVAPDKPIKIKPVKFDVVAIDWNELTHSGGNIIEYHIDSRPGKLPEGVRITDLLSNETLSEIEYSMEHPISGNANVWGGVIKQNRSGNNGITSLISIEDIWKVFPKNLPPLSFAVGIGEGGRVFYKDLDDCPHLLDVGGTGNGKSNLINSIICTYLWRGLTKDQVQFVLFDCKQGMELSFYEDIPHLYKDEQIPTGIIEEFDDAIPAMYHLLDVMKKRMVTIREAKCKSMNDYNMTRRGRNRMPSLVIVFDDYVNLSLSFGNRADDVITKISNQGRAAGIYIILGAQYPKSERFPSIALVNFSVIVAFLMKPGGSRSILGDNSAAGLSCIGRAIFQDRNNENEVQTPFISKDIIKACVLGAKTGTKPLQASKIDFEEILAYALEHQEGFVSSTKLYPFFKGLIGRNKLQTLITNADEQVYDVKGTLYKITGYPRKMIIADGSVIDPIADVEQS